MRTSKRDRIITGALELAHRDGFDTLTFDALAEHVGLTRGGVIYHFRTKTDLLEGIAAAFLERWRAHRGPARQCRKRGWPTIHPRPAAPLAAWQ